MDLEYLQKQKDESLTNYINKLQDFKDVCKGGKNFYNCSMMDITIRNDRMEEAKKHLIDILGKIELEKIENTIKLQGN